MIKMTRYLLLGKRKITRYFVPSTNVPLTKVFFPSKTISSNFQPTLGSVGMKERTEEWLVGWLG
jgi:hypothetical protein